ncbi:IS30 family transposase [Salegentibacter sp. JZCK2]|uniref:IS30 family transposase n=1 Tax=Salegentibacter tibetensis TaxID=2873600 RepID=UPI001CCE91B8|nr:IS30 family transposase [Salegentibacter tibetensis]MBZ9731432.1 IS30 family transposase [Salegentibacter tibetensis]
MKKKFKQLDQEQRCHIGALLEAGKNKSEIADIIGVHKSTISRELKRNVGTRGQHAGKYVPRLAQGKTADRRRNKKPIQFTDDLKQQAAGWLRKEQLSPELIAVEWKFMGIKGNYKDTRGIIKDRVSIEERPAIVDTRERLGDVEEDLMMGKNHNSALLVMTERATLITTLDLPKSKESRIVNEMIDTRLNRIGSSWIKTMTFDNGNEFAGHREIAKKHKIKTYFTRPYTSQDKDTIENRIGLIRRFLPKKTDLNLISENRINEIEELINNRRVRKFDYISPIEKLKSPWPVAFIT